jgi:putative colanic acid biosynthesis glycosyltransferase
MSSLSALDVHEASTPSLHVLHLSVRIGEGGAAGVARTLMDELAVLGVEGTFAYGYGPGGRDSEADATRASIRVTSQPRAAVNMAAHMVVGTEVVPPAAPRRVVLRAAIREADVVHLHIVHSYWLPPRWLFREIADAGTPVVWTLHDQWIMTGRCAQPGTCRLWEQGCPRCPDLKAYPPARVDTTARGFVRRRDEIAALRRAVPTTIVACAHWLAEEASTAGFTDVRTITNSVDRAFWSVATAAPVAADAPRAGALFICRDLRDPAKVDWDTLRAVATGTVEGLTIMGDDAPQEAPGATRLPSTSDRGELARVMRRHDRLVFTSRVDYFPLTVTEALTAGMRVFAVDSPAIREFGSHPDVTVLATGEELASALLSDERDRVRLAVDGRDVRDFDPRRMACEYRDVYTELVSR